MLLPSAPAPTALVLTILSTAAAAAVDAAVAPIDAAVDAAVAPIAAAVDAAA